MESLRSNACRSMLLEDGCTIFVLKPLNVNPCSIELNDNLQLNCLPFGLCDENVWSGRFPLICWPSLQFLNPSPSVYLLSSIGLNHSQVLWPLSIISPDGKSCLRHLNWHKHWTNSCGTHLAVLQHFSCPPLLEVLEGACNSLYATARDSFPPGVGMSSWILQYVLWIFSMACQKA